jgi:hypothetical protein
MAARDILSLDAPMAPRLVRILYFLALILIALGVVLGVARGIGDAGRMPSLPPLTAAATPQLQMPQTTAPRVDGVRGRGTGRRFAGRGMNRPVFGIGARRQPVLFGALLIVRALLMGFIALLVVRILAEMALSVVNLPQRGEL